MSLKRKQPTNIALRPDGYGLPKNVLMKAEEINARASEAKLNVGRAGRAVRAASLYAACRVLGYPITLTEVARLHGCGRTAVGRLYTKLVRELDLRPAPENPADYVVRKKQFLKREVVMKALRILERCGNYAMGKKPAAVAAAATYLASDKSLRQEWLGQIFSTTALSIRKHSKEMEQFLKGP